MRIVIADDNTIVREGLAALLQGRGHDVVAAVGTGEAVLPAIASEQVDVAVMDIRMPPTHTDEGVRAAVRLKAARPEVGVLLFSQYAEVGWARALLDVATVGVGYLLKDRVAEVTTFIDSLQQVAAGHVVLDPEVAAALVQAPRPLRDRLDQLTARETDVLRLMAEGRSNAAIAEALFLSGGTVEKHVTAVFAKLGLEATPSDHRRVLAVLRFLSA
ncbi:MULTISPECIES: response regulator transcription factor [unclassified Curtobacterium]|uniref:response regulator transcription factor n=1 Tax=unclassified Curtobacterium TaxID=257496 RepID=UPI0008DDFB42|nr:MULTISPECIES: response regulator transcription factor [unclassified Curtobacterium]OIH99570.1 DNA-binding response regulator [Curtobacterium sp. MCBA15_003]OII11475.1 DNA-binding response regulator [Curtobacterium sp. MCBA15_009]OII30595.1 DNA-binding response regulator [Curtobacterium sp. MMLR14_006]WIE64864.1 response regulator transcription factor [Curtobacterium sp. MCLR17_036]